MMAQDFPVHIREAAEEILREGATEAYQEWLDEDGKFTEEEFDEIRKAMRDATIIVTWEALDV